jgi:hypothetical protein
MLSTASVAKSELRKHSDGMKSEIIYNETINNNSHLVGENPLTSHDNSNTNLVSGISRIKNTFMDRPPINNIINVSNAQDKDTIILEYNYKDKRFLFHDKNKSFLGSFTGNEFIKYVVVSMVPLFMTDTYCKSSQDIIEKYICTVNSSKSTIEINIKNHLESPFTGQVEMLIKLYKQIEDFEINQLKDELNLLSKTDKILAEKTFMNLVYCLLNHTLKIIAILSDIIKTENNDHMKTKLLKYSVAIMYKISSVTRNEIDKRIENIDDLLNEKIRLDAIKDTFIEKVLVLEQNILNQDEKIREVSALMENSHQSGGSINSNQNSSSNAISTSAVSTTVDSDNKYVSSSSDVDNIIGDESASTSLSQMVGNISSDPQEIKHKEKSSKSVDYSSTSSYYSSNGFKESLSDNINDLDYLTSNEVSSSNKVINV